MHIPVLMGLLGADGQELVDADLVLESDARTERRGTSLLLHLRDAQTRLQVRGLQQEPKLSFLRGFSAPVRVRYPRSAEAWPSCPATTATASPAGTPCKACCCGSWTALRDGTEVSQLVLDLFGGLIAEARKAEDAETGAMLREMLSPPSESYVFEQSEHIDVEGVIGARDRLIATTGPGPSRRLARSL